MKPALVKEGSYIYRNIKSCLALLDAKYNYNSYTEKLSCAQI